MLTQKHGAISLIFTRFTRYKQNMKNLLNGFDFKNGFLLSILSSLFTSVVQKIFPLLKISKGITVSIRNTPHYTFQEGIQESYYSNLVENIVYFSGGKQLIIEKIILNKFIISPYEYEEFIGVDDFNYLTQTFKGYVYQNGNANQVISSFRLQLLKKLGRDEKPIDCIESAEFKFNKGDVHNVATLSLGEDVLKHFGEEQIEHLLIRTYLGGSEQLLSESAFYYNPKDKKFTPSGRGGNGQTYEVLNLFEVTSPYQSCYEKITSSPISESEPLKLNLLFSETNRYSYQLELYAKGRKLPVVGAERSIDVRFPNYDKDVMFKKLSQVMESYQVDYLTGEDLKLILPEAIYTLEKFKKMRGLIKN